MPGGQTKHNKSLEDLLGKRETIEGRLREWNEEKRQVESNIFKRLIKEERIEYFTINWRKLHADKHRNRL